MQKRRPQISRITDRALCTDRLKQTLYRERRVQNSRRYPGKLTVFQRHYRRTSLPKYLWNDINPWGPTLNESHSEQSFSFNENRLKNSQNSSATQTGKNTSAVRETSVSRHNEGKIEGPPSTIMLWWFNGFQHGHQLGPSNAERRQSLGQLCAWSLLFFSLGNSVHDATVIRSFVHSSKVFYLFIQGLFLLYNQLVSLYNKNKPWMNK